MISFSNVNLAFGDKRVLESFTFDLDPHGVICLMGPSGCGKTTFARLCAGLVKPDSGQVLSSFSRPAFMFQEDRLLPSFSVRRNLQAVLPRRSFGLIDDYLAAVGLAGEADSLPAELSGGMRRRAALARTIAWGGDLLILDEPFKGLDAPLAAELASLVYAQPVPVLVITHSAREAALLGGRIITFDGPPLSVSQAKI